MIILPSASHSRPPTLREQIDEAAREFSNNERERECFREGAEFMIDDEESGPWGIGDWLALIAVIYVAINTFAFLAGAVTSLVIPADGYRYRNSDCTLPGKTVYVVPAYIAGCEGMKWLKQ